MNWLLAPLQYDFIIRALLAAVIVGVVCSVLGVYIVLRGMAFLGDAMAHTILPGVVAAYFLGWPLAVGALVMGVLTALGIGLLTRRTALKEDTAIGVIFAGFFALGLALATGRPVALLCTSGTAAANFHPAVIEAYYAAVPLLVLTADRPPELRDSGANQTIDQVKMFGDHVRWAVDAPVPQAGVPDTGDPAPKKNGPPLWVGLGGFDRYQRGESKRFYTSGLHIACQGRGNPC